MFITRSQYMARRCLTSPGAPDLWTEVGQAPRQYTEWNVVGHARSTGDPSQQGLLPKVRCTASAKGVLTKMTKYQRTPGSMPWWLI